MTDLWNDFKTSKFYSRKLLVVFIGSIAVIVFPEASGSIAAIVGLFCGANTAAKFASTSKEITGVIDSTKKLVNETTNPPQS